MKLLRHGAAGAEKPGMLVDGEIRDLSGIVADIGGAVLSDAGLAALRDVDASALPVVVADTRLGPCVAGTGKLYRAELFRSRSRNRGHRAARADHLHEGHIGHLRPE